MADGDGTPEQKFFEIAKIGADAVASELAAETNRKTKSSVTQRLIGDFISPVPEPAKLAFAAKPSVIICPLIQLLRSVRMVGQG